MRELEIRKATTNDAGELSELIYENADSLLKPHYNEQQWTIFLKYYSPEVLKKKITTQHLFCAVTDSLIVGCIGLEGDFVVGFYTRLNYRNRGIGKLLMDHLELYAKVSGIKRLHLAASPEGLRFYYKNGWIKVRDIVIDHYGVGFCETLMEKQI